MTNTEIIARESVANGIYTKEQVESLISNFIDLGLHTYQEWKRLGYQVKKGEKAIFKTKLWRYKNAKKSVDDEEEESYYYLTNAYIFSRNQVERLEACL